MADRVRQAGRSTPLAIETRAVLCCDAPRQPITLWQRRPALRVLIIDANDERAEAVAQGLREAGCEIVGRADEHADWVELIRSLSAEIVVCDLDSPSRDAIESIQAVSRDEPRPVVMFVDRSDPEQTAAAVEAGVAAYVIEGLVPSRVRAVIDVAVPQFRAHQALRAELAATRAALAERKLVERAKGLLMRGRRLSEDDAYRTLRRLAMDQGKRLGDVAADVIAMADLLKS